MTSTLTPYTYRPLSNPSAIRLIKILPDLEYNRARCTIHHFDNPYVPGLRYHALSYFWGNPDPRRRICLGDTPDAMHRYPVHESIWDFLNQLWEDKNFDCYFWTDTLCLNQKDMIEINQQVIRMGEIYSAAEEVVSWISTSYDDRYHKPQFSDLAENVYWQRVWIMQEVVLAKKGRVLYGDMTIDLDDLLSQLTSSILYNNLITISDLRKSQNRKVDLWKLLKGFKGIESTKPADKIYGILGLIEDEEGQPPTAQLIGVDYRKDINEILWDLIFQCQHKVLPGKHGSVIETVGGIFGLSRSSSGFAGFQMLEAYCKEARTSELHASYAAVALRVYDASLIFMHVLTSLRNWAHWMSTTWKAHSPCKTKKQDAAYIGFQLTAYSTPKDILKWDAHKEIVDEWAELSRLTSWRCGTHFDREHNPELLPETLKLDSDGSVKLNQSNLRQVWEKLSSSCDVSNLYLDPEDYTKFPRVCKKFSSVCDGSMMVFNMPDVGFRIVVFSVEDEQKMFVILDR